MSETGLDFINAMNQAQIDKKNAAGTAMLVLQTGATG